MRWTSTFRWFECSIVFSLFCFVLFCFADPSLQYIGGFAFFLGRNGQDRTNLGKFVFETNGVFTEDVAADSATLTGGIIRFCCSLVSCSLFPPCRCSRRWEQNVRSDDGAAWALDNGDAREGAESRCLHHCCGRDHLAVLHELQRCVLACLA